MYKQTIDLGAGENLQLDWGKNFANLSIYQDGQLIGSFPDKASLKLGNRFLLNGTGRRQVTVILAEQGLEVWENGVDLLSGMKSGDSNHFDIAAKYLMGFGLLQSIIRIVVSSMNDAQEDDLSPAAILIIVLGLGLTGLGFWAKRTGQTLPLRIALLLLVINIVLILIVGRMFGLFLNGLMIYYLYKGIRAGALQTAKAKEFSERGPLDAGL